MMTCYFIYLPICVNILEQDFDLFLVNNKSNFKCDRCKKNKNDSTPVSSSKSNALFLDVNKEITEDHDKDIQIRTILNENLQISTPLSTGVRKSGCKPCVNFVDTGDTENLGTNENRNMNDLLIKSGDPIVCS